jgi:hypothetical protein
MRLNRPLYRPVCALLAASLLLASCSPPPSIYSRDPVDEDGEPLSNFELRGLELRDHTRYELAEGEILFFESGTLIIRSRVRPDGSRRQRVFDLDELELLKVRRSDGSEAWYPVATPADLTEYDVLPRVDEIVLVDGERIPVGRDNKARWAPGKLAILVGPRGAEDAELRPLSLEEIQTIRLSDTNPVKSTLLSPKFWIVGAAAVGVAWWIAGRADTDNLAVE